MKTPRFSLAPQPHGHTVIVEAAPHREKPDVLFEMLGSTTLRNYNAVSPKEENMGLAFDETDESRRIVIAEMPVSEVYAHMARLITEFEGQCDDYRRASDDMLEGLVAFAKNRMAAGHIEQDLAS